MVNHKLTTKKTKSNKKGKANTENENEIYRSFNHLSISKEEYNKLQKNYTDDQIESILNKIQNYKKNKNYTSLYLTSLEWLKKEFKPKTGNEGIKWR